MAIPKFYQLFPDVLRSLSHFDQILAKDFSALVMNQLELTAAELAEQNPGGGNRVRSRVHWAVAYLVQASAENIRYAFFDFQKYLYEEAAV